MYDQHALIVDDSKTAQLRLKRMLEAYELEIDVVSSAEEALAYLSYRVPAVIFLDQSMQGMDGIEALRTIKANPSTATIPVIMYTSERGSIFTGQARALGALDILYKSTLKPSSLDQVLRTLKIPMRKRARKATPDKPAAKQPAAAPAANAKFRRDSEPLTRADLDDIRGQIARLFEIHISDVARQITKSTQFLSKRFAASSEGKLQKPLPAEAEPESDNTNQSNSRRPAWLTLTNGAIAVLAVMILSFGLLLVGISSRLDTLSDDYTNLAQAAAQNNAQMAEFAEQMYRTTAAASANDSVNSRSLNLLKWAASTDFAFDFDEEPLSESMVSRVEELVYQLDDAGFNGVIELNLNFGNSCLTQSDAGEWVLAPAELPAYDCVFRSALEPDFSVNNYLSRPYLSFEQRSPVLRDGTITLVVDTRGVNNPRVPYPPVSGSITAGDWNEVARQNNYLSFAFHSMQ